MTQEQINQLTDLWGKFPKYRPSHPRFGFLVRSTAYWYWWEVPSEQPDNWTAQHIIENWIATVLGKHKDLHLYVMRDPEGGWLCSFSNPNTMDGNNRYLHHRAVTRLDALTQAAYAAERSGQ